MRTDESCIFCKIIAGKIPSKKIYEDDRFVCIQDIQPQAKVHLLVLPREHVASLATAFSEELQMTEMGGQLLQTATKIAREQGLLPDGFRAVINTNKYGGQTVDHLHLHILGGEPLGGSFG